MNLSTILRKIEHIISVSEDGYEDTPQRKIELMRNHARSAKEELSKLQKNMTDALGTIERLNSSREQQLKKASERRQLHDMLNENVVLKEQLKKFAKKRKRGIIFNSDEVNATLSKQKTQMRRIVSQETYCDHHGYSGNWKEIDGLWHYVSVHGGGEPIKCPYGRVGDILGVKETWGYHGSTSGGSPEENYKTVSYHADNTRRDIHFDTFEEMEKLGPHQNIKKPAYIEKLYESDYESYCIEMDSLLKQWWEKQKKISSVYMSLWTSRIFLEITDIRIERVADISTEDAKAEGCKEWHAKKDWVEKLNYKGNYRNSFREVWESMNIKKGYDWDMNPWVWVIKFKVIEIKETKDSTIKRFADDVIKFNIER